MTSVSKNIYVDKLVAIVNKYNSKCHNTIKMNPVGVKSNKYIEIGKDSNNKYPKFKIGDTVRVSKYKNIFAKGYLQTGLKRFLWLKKLKILRPEHMLLLILMEKKLLECLTKKSCKRQIKKSLELKKLSREKGINCMLNGKDMILCFIVE